MATDSSVLAWRIPGMGEPGGLPSMGSHRVGHDWSNLAAAAAAASVDLFGGLGSRICRLSGWDTGKGHFLAEMSTASDRRLWVDLALASPLHFWEFLFWLHEGPGILKASSLLPSPLGFASLQKSRGKQDTEHPALLPSPSLRTAHPAQENHPSFLVGGGLCFDYSPIHFVWALIFLRCLEDFFLLIYPHVKTINTGWTGWLCDF